MSKYTPEQIVEICEKYLSGKKSYHELSFEYNLKKGKPSGCFWRWLALFREQGAEAFIKPTSTHKYTTELKINAVEEYLAGNGSLFDICKKYDISAEGLLLSWINKYNAGIELKEYIPMREVYMAETRRKTTIEERKEIVDYCINNNRDYKGTASIYDVSYSQVYSWVKKYDAHGEEGLTDKRGHHKTDDEVDELERLRRENIRLKRQLQEKDMLTELLKKVQEFERM